MAIKLDIFEVYDKFQWSFLEAMMRRLGFNESWIAKIMACVTTISYILLVNGQPGHLITPTKRSTPGGSHLSLSIFTLC